MGSVPDGGYHKISREGAGKSILGTCIREFRSDGGSWHMVGIEWASTLTFVMLCSSIRRIVDARHTTHPWECHGVRHHQKG